MNTEISIKLDGIEAKAAHATANPGPAAEIQQYWTGVVNNKRVVVVRRDGSVHHYEITDLGSHVRFARTRAEAEEAIAA